MSTNAPSIEDVREQAANWAVRISEGDLSEPEQQAFQRWLLEDARHSEEFRAHRGVQSLAAELPPAAVERLSALVPEIDAPPSYTGKRRHLLALAAAVVVAVIGIGWFGMRFQDPGTQVFATVTGETRDVVFEDGSVAHMNTRTRLEWLGDEQDRRVRLIEGEALFDVVPDASRPFRVLLDNSEIRVVGTSFNVYRKKDGNVVVSVLEGEVTVHERNGAWESRLHAGQELTYRSIGPVEAVRETSPEEAVRWREGELELRGQPLAEVVDELTRYTDQPILIRDPELARFNDMGGALQLRDVRAALQWLEDNFEQIDVSESNGVFIIDSARE